MENLLDTGVGRLNPKTLYYMYFLFRVRMIMTVIYLSIFLSYFRLPLQTITKHYIEITWHWLSLCCTLLLEPHIFFEYLAMWYICTYMCHHICDWHIVNCCVTQKIKLELNCGAFNYIVPCQKIIALESEMTPGTKEYIVVVVSCWLDISDSIINANDNIGCGTTLCRKCHSYNIPGRGHNNT